MQIILIAFVVAILAMCSVISKMYNERNEAGGVHMFTAIRCFGAMLVFIAVSKGNLDFSPAVIWHALGFAVAYGACSVFQVLAIRTGSLSLTSLLTSYSLMIPTFYGLLFLGEPFTAWILSGILLLAVSLFLIHFKRDQATFSWRWLLFVLLAFFGNGMCSTVQRMQQIAFDNAYSNEFMILALGIIIIFLSIFGFATAPEESKKTVKKAWNWGWGIGYGVANGLMNYFVIVLNRLQTPASVMFPIISCGSILLVFLISRIFWKEKLSRMQLAGAAVGILSIIFFSL